PGVIVEVAKSKLMMSHWYLVLADPPEAPLANASVPPPSARSATRLASRPIRRRMTTSPPRAAPARKPSLHLPLPYTFHGRVSMARLDYMGDPLYTWPRPPAGGEMIALPWRGFLRIGQCSAHHTGRSRPRRSSRSGRSSS